MDTMEGQRVERILRYDQHSLCVVICVVKVPDREGEPEQDNHPWNGLEGFDHGGEPETMEEG